MSDFSWVEHLKVGWRPVRRGWWLQHAWHASPAFPIAWVAALSRNVSRHPPAFQRGASARGSIREGFDCILRAGELKDSSLIGRKLAMLERGTFASPGYLERKGTPNTLDDLEGREMIGLLAPDSRT